MIPVKKKLKMPQREAISFIQNDAKSMRSHSSRRSGFGKLGAKSQKVMKNGKDPNTIEEAVLPIPISSQKTEAPEEEALRVRKELQIKKKKEENEKLKIIQKEEEDNLKKLQKDSDEIKNKSFTYDTKGKIILITPIHYDSIPPSYSVLNYNPEPLAKEDPKPVKRNKSRNEFVSIKRIKSTPNQEKEWVRNMTTLQVSLIDVIKLNPGVTFIDGARTKYPTEDNQASQNMSRKKYVSLYKTVEPVNTLSDKKSVSISSAGSFRRSPDSKKDLLQVIPDYDEFDNSENRGIDGVNKDLPLNYKEIHGKVMQYGNGLDFSLTDGPNEQFNAEILKNKQWGANPPLKEPKLIERLPKRPSSKELRELYGNILKKPKDNPFITPQEL